jgi:hypothetical protein
MRRKWRINEDGSKERTEAHEENDKRNDGHGEIFRKIVLNEEIDEGFQDFAAV